MDKKDKILIVDDEPGNVFLLELMLEDKYELLKANNGQDAITITEQELPDLILLDIMMPKMDGLAVCKKLFQDSKTKDIPVILVSAKTMDEDVEKGLDIGAVDYIKKPISSVDLKARIRTALKLKHREDELKKLNKLKTEFLQIVSHDLLSPFTGIVSTSQMLLNKDFGNPLNHIQRELLDIINNSANKQLRYVKDLLSLALKESDKFILEKEKISLKNLVDDVIKANKFAASQKDITLINSVPEEIEIYADPDIFIQVLNNLSINAIKFTYKDGKIQFLAENTDDYSLIKIKDTGKGMSPEKIKELLGKGKIYSTPGTEDEPGTGLGITICKKIIEAHNGTITIESKEKKGSIFIISIPGEKEDNYHVNEDSNDISIKTTL